MCSCGMVCVEWYVNMCVFVSVCIAGVCGMVGAHVGFHVCLQRGVCSMMCVVWYVHMC